MTPFSQILKLATDYQSINNEYAALTERLQSGDSPVEVDVLFTDGPYRTKLLLSTIVAEVDNARKQIANSLESIGIDINA